MTLWGELHAAICVGCCGQPRVRLFSEWPCATGRHFSVWKIIKAEQRGIGKQKPPDSLGACDGLEAPLIRSGPTVANGCAAE